MLSGSALFDQSANALTITRKFLQRISLQLFYRISKSFWYLLETHSTSASKKAVCIFILARSADLIGSILFVNHCQDQGRWSLMMYTMLWGWKGNTCQVAKMGWEIWVQLPSTEASLLSSLPLSWFISTMDTVAKHSSIIIVIIIIWAANSTDLLILVASRPKTKQVLSYT